MTLTGGPSSGAKMPPARSDNPVLDALLRDAYVKARYSRSYVITTEQLDWISERVSVLQTLVREACEQRIETLAKAA